METELRKGEVWFMPNDQASFHTPNVHVKMSAVLAARLIEQGHGEIISDSKESEPVKAEPVKTESKLKTTKLKKQQS